MNQPTKAQIESFVFEYYAAKCLPWVFILAALPAWIYRGWGAVFAVAIAAWLVSLTSPNPIK